MLRISLFKRIFQQRNTRISGSKSIMASGQRILKNSIFLSASQIAAKVINFLLILVLTRFLGKEGFGLYSFSFAYVSIFFFLTHMGINHLLVRDLAKRRETTEEYISYSLPLVLLFSTSYMIIVNIIPTVLSWNNQERLITFFFSLYFLFDGLGKYFLAVLRAYERMGFEALLFTAERLLILVAAVYCWYTDFPLLILVLMFACILGIKAMIAFLIVRINITRITLSWSDSHARSMLKQSYPFALVLLFSSVGARLDLLFLKGFHSNEAVAIYNTARKIIEALSFLPENIYAAVFPSLSLFFISQKEKFNNIFRQAFIAILIAAVPIAAGLCILAPNLIAVLFQPEFYPAQDPLQWLSIGLFLMYIRMALSLVLNTTGDQHKFAFIYGIGMVVSMIMNFLLIPKFEITGACIALICSEISIIICTVPFILKHVNLSWLNTFIPRITALAVVFSTVVYWMRDWNLISITVISGVIYILLLLIFKIVPISELRSYRNLFSNKE